VIEVAFFLGRPIVIDRRTNMSATKKQLAPPPSKQIRAKGRLHLDRRAGAIADAIPIEATDDELLSTPQVAMWFGVSQEWLEIGRTKNYGPPYLKLAPQVIRYRRGDLRQWLQARQYAYSAEYPDSDRDRDARLKKVPA
jgi:predicted DNA-binding transcriptional regulator AlpA